MDKKEIVLLNDSFPPAIDGVANVIMNYARQLQESRDYTACVVTPEYPGADDSAFPYAVYRYPSVDLRKQLGYTAGIPLVPSSLHALSQKNAALLHSHCPFASNYMARALREQLNVPLVLTYHTKFDVDIANAIKGKALQRGAIKALVESVSAADELWVVSKGAGENIRKLGYTGDYYVMQNGVDMPRGRATEAQIAAATAGYDLPSDLPVFLFVGRMMWYKGLRIILDAMAALKSQNYDFRMVFVGGGGNEADVKAYASKNKLDDKCLFTGPIRDREALRAWYSRADLFLFPSDFDTNGLVVREAAACGLGSVMLADSCAAEGVTGDLNGLLVQNNAASLAVCLCRIMEHKDAMRKIGANAAADLYLSWPDAIALAKERYAYVIEEYNAGHYSKKRKLTDKALAFGSDLLNWFETIGNPSMLMH